MPDNTTATSTAAAPATKENPTVLLKVGNTELPTQEAVYGGNSKLKGRPYLKPRFKNSNNPDATELLAWTTALGAAPLLAAFGRIITKAVAEGTVDAFSQDAEGKYSNCDLSVAARGVVEEVSELIRTDADEIRGQIAAAQSELNKKYDQLLEYASKGQQAPQPMLNGIVQQKLALAKLEEKIKPRARKAKASAPVVTAPAAPVAPAAAPAK